ncbi:hypothetical protein [Streptomyces sp. TLI_171]|uniref:hypothetical protein n=1 Tax=Streptomyces sp. TLI_171 TaxID=1938859 RepID=UPI000C18BA3C|nr:hypothetical protein [Streptomyces sp. TLI_171]RKE20404.1 hypothetical protein BX266_3761 [Streptomyces sp. TLI_171]
MSTEPTGATEPGAAAANPFAPPADPPAEPPAAPPADTPSATTRPTETRSPDLPAGDVLTAEAPATAPDADPFTDAFAVRFENSEVIEAGAEPARRKRKFSANALFLAAVLAGPVIGGVIGYGIQAARPETPLPKITAVKLDYPAERIDPGALAAAAPKPLNIDGDLRDLLVKKPDGVQEITDFGSNGWMDAADIAETFGNTKSVFQELLLNGFRRAAVVAWEVDGTEYRVQLIQYVPESTSTVISDLNVSTAGSDTSKIPGNDDSQVLVKRDAQHYAKSTEQYYYGEALARKGTVLMHIQVYAKNPVDRAKLEDLAKRQWERIA